MPFRIKNLTDAEALEAQLIENLQRRDVHPMEEAEGFKRLLDLEDPKYSIEQIAAKTGKTPAYVAQRLKLTELSEPAVEAFYREEIGVGHALLLAKLPADRQTEALAACFKEDWSAGGKEGRSGILLPVRSLQFWIETNVLLLLKEAPFDKRDAHLVAIAGSCADCAKRTGHNKLLFSDLGKQDACTDATCYQAKVDAHVPRLPSPPNLSWCKSAPLMGSKRKAVRFSRATGIRRLRKRSRATRRKRSARSTRPASSPPTPSLPKAAGRERRTRSAPIPDCPVHHPKKKGSREDEAWKAQQDKQRREQAIANATGLRVLAAVSAAVPVRLLKRDFAFVLEKLVSLMDEPRLEMLARQHGIRQKRDDGGIGKTLAAFLRRADEGTLSRLLVQTAVLLAAARTNPASVLKDAAATYKVDTDAITAKVKQEFAAKAKAKKEPKSVPNERKAA